MMNNLFSIFDPTSSIMMLKLNWMSSMVWILFIPPIMWVSLSRPTFISNSFSTSLTLEFMNLTKSKMFMLTLMAIMLTIMISNVMGLTPYTFTATSHMIMTLSMALPVWTALMLFGWIKKTFHMFSHLVPQGTPAPLMPFMVLIETVSNLIRPGTLSIRLAANMIAGHLLLTLLGNQGPNMDSLPLISILISTQILLFLLESAVAMIQAYVFTVLTTLYIAEL